jgi:arylsulfatase A-like enzyme
MAASSSSDFHLRRGLLGAGVASLLFSVALVIKSLLDFTHTGPAIRAEIAEHFLSHSLLSVILLGFWAFLIALLLASAGVLVLAALSPAKKSHGYLGGFLSGGIGIGIGSGYQFAHVLLHAPSTIIASWNYAPSRLVAVWPYLDTDVLLFVKTILFLLVAFASLILVRRYRREGRSVPAAALSVAAIGIGTLIAWVHWQPEPVPSGALQAVTTPSRPNILMIGSDGLRADRLGVAGNTRELTPFLDSLANRGSFFSQAYAPVGRTAPSITSILTGTWPVSHTIRDNFVRDEQKQLATTSLPKLLRSHGYNTAAVGDWAASDIGKIDFGFESLIISPDQWNFKYLLSQGPKDLRLYVSLFTGNEAGRILVPQLYYLAGRPLTSQKGRHARIMLSRLAEEQEPFFLMVFMATTHGPFGSDYPYYTLFSGEDYTGDAKFAITGVTTPEEVARRQAQGRDDFDVQQIMDLYDGAVRQFDDEARKVVEHIRRLGIGDNTIIVLFSDHGTDMFERGTWGQGNIVGVHDYSSHIPLVILDPRRPGTAPINRIVRIVDLAPTLAELAGLDPPPAFEGTSLVPYLDNPQEDLRLASYNESGALLAHIHGLEEGRRKAPPLLELLEVPDKGSGTISISEQGEAAIAAARQNAIRTDRWMAMRTPMEDGDHYALYDLTVDADGMTNLAEERPDVLACFRIAFSGEGSLARRLADLPPCLDENGTASLFTQRQESRQH